MGGASLGGLLVGPLAGGGVRRRVALHDELAPARGAALLQHAVLRAARAHGVPRHGQPRDGVVHAAAAARRALRAALLSTSTGGYIVNCIVYQLTIVISLNCLYY